MAFLFCSLFLSQSLPIAFFWVPGSLSFSRAEGAGVQSTPAPIEAHPVPATLPDVNECWASPSRLCQHTCENTLGSYRCSCASGFVLAADGKHCEGTGLCTALCRALSPAPSPCHPSRPALASATWLFSSRAPSPAGTCQPSQTGGWVSVVSAQSAVGGGGAPRGQVWQPSPCLLDGSDPGH